MANRSRTGPNLKHRWQQVLGEDGTCTVVEGRQDTVSQVSNFLKICGFNCITSQNEPVQIRMERETVMVKNQLQDYAERPEELENENIILYFCKTYDQYGIRSGDNGEEQESVLKDGGGRRTSTRYRYMGNHRPRSY